MINCNYTLGSTKIQMDFIFFFNPLFKYPQLINLYGFLDNVHKFQVVKRLDCLLLLLVFLLLLLFCKVAAFRYRNRPNLQKNVFKQVYYCTLLATYLFRPQVVSSLKGKKNVYIAEYILAAKSR